MKSLNLDTPLNSKTIEGLKAGDLVNITGVIYTARDKAHGKMLELLSEGKKLPFSLKGAIIYYCGPTPPRKGEIIGSCGPTTSSRMDGYTPLLYKYGLKATIGKGERSREVREAIEKYGGIYFITWGGCGAYLRRFITRAKVIAFSELGTEAIYELEVKDFPAIVAIDSRGKAIFNSILNPTPLSHFVSGAEEVKYVRGRTKIKR